MAKRPRRNHSPTSQELARLTQTIARRVGRYLERQGLLERDAENSYLAPEAVPEDPMAQLLSHSFTGADHRVARETVGAASRFKAIGWGKGQIVPPPG